MRERDGHPAGERFESNEMMRTVRPSRRKADDPGGSQKPCYAIGSPCANLIMARRRHAAPHTGRRYDCCRDPASLIDFDAEPAGTIPRSERAPPPSAGREASRYRVRLGGYGA